MRIRSSMGQKVVTVPDKLGRALIRSGRYVDADVPAEAKKPKSAKKRTYKRRDMRAEG